MAKLRARGRREIFRVSRAQQPDEDRARAIASIDHYRALMSDGNVLSRMVVHYTDEEIRKNYGRRSHDHGWSVKGRAKAGLTAEQLLKGYLDKGWQLEAASPDYFRTGPGFVEGISDAPLISEARAASRRSSLARQREKRDAKAARRSGPGFYVTNGYTGSSILGRSRVADHPHPFGSFEEAEEWAVGRLRHLSEMRLDYLLPVLIIEAPSRADAEAGRGHVWWQNGKFRGGPVDPAQTGFDFGDPS